MISVGSRICTPPTDRGWFRDLRRNFGNRFAGDPGARRPDQVHLQRRVLVRVVAAVVAAAGLSPLQRTFERRAGREHRGPQVEGVGQVLVAGDVRVDSHVGHALLDGLQLRQACQQPGFVTHHPGVLGHQVADGALQAAHVFLAAGSEQFGDVCAGCGDGLGRARLGGQRRGVLRGMLAHDAPEDQQLDERVPAQPVRPVQTGRGLTDGVETWNFGGM